MSRQELLTHQLADLADAIDDGGPLQNAMLLGMPLISDDGQPREPYLKALGFRQENGTWLRGGERYVMGDGTTVSADIPLSEIESLRRTLLKRAETYAVAVFIPEAAELAAVGLADQYHPVKNMLTLAPNLRLLFAPGANQRSELASLLACRAVTWPQAIRITLEAHASYPVAPNAGENMAAASRFIIRETKGADRPDLLEQLALRYGRAHAAEAPIENDEDFRQALTPYLRKAFLHE
jgi:hypothetical protein